VHEDAAGAQSDRPANRPALHLTTRSGWINDPRGLTYHGGRYHMFFQYVPAQVLWGPQCWWGHAVSEDLLSWTGASRSAAWRRRRRMLVGQSRRGRGGPGNDFLHQRPA
jgi:sucrose-6-phosphate hydrolase SacC (GH32 family)